VEGAVNVSELGVPIPASRSAVTSYGSSFGAAGGEVAVRAGNKQRGVWTDSRRSRTLVIGLSFDE
jgi:hypothetical protein